jgi:hypothetical protein
VEKPPPRPDAGMSGFCHPARPAARWRAGHFALWSLRPRSPACSLSLSWRCLKGSRERPSHSGIARGTRP